MLRRLAPAVVPVLGLGLGLGFAVDLGVAHADASGGPATIIGGTPAPAGKWPDAVAVLGDGACTGTLIAPDVVLTAGHCADPAPTEVIANTTNYNAAGGVRATVKSVTAYPNWENSYDVAIIVLNTPMTGVTPRKLGTACTFEGFSATSRVQLVGFGLTDIQAEGDNTRLNEVTVPVTDPTCSRGDGCVAAVSPGGEFVAGGNGVDSCNGDSGGPVYLDTPRGPVVIGAVSRATESAATPCGAGGIYVRTDKLVQWIEQTAGKAVEKDTCATTPPAAEDEDPGTGNGDGAGDGTGNNHSFDQPDISGGCATTGSRGGLAAGLLAAAALVATRRRRR